MQRNRNKRQAAQEVVELTEAQFSQEMVVCPVLDCKTKLPIPNLVTSKEQTPCNDDIDPDPDPEEFNPCSILKCGTNAKCVLHPDNGAVQCVCLDGFEGVPYVECKAKAAVNDPCSPSPCGEAAVCSQIRTVAICNCPEGFTGNAFVQCQRPGN